MSLRSGVFFNQHQRKFEFLHYCYMIMDNLEYTEAHLKFAKRASHRTLGMILFGEKLKVSGEFVLLFPRNICSVTEGFYSGLCSGKSASSSSFFLVVVFCVLLRAQCTTAVFNMMFLSRALSRLAACPVMRRLTDLSRSRKISHLALVPICSLGHR